ncbi:MAG: hypothetical protein WCI30_01225 [Clostridia bacterium]
MQDMNDSIDNVKKFEQSIRKQEKITTYLLHLVAQQTGKSYGKLLEEVERFSQQPDFVEILTKSRVAWKGKTLFVSQRENDVVKEYSADKFDFAYSEDLGILSLVMDKNKKGRLEREIGYLEFVEYDINTKDVIVALNRKDGSMVEFVFSE